MGNRRSRIHPYARSDGAEDGSRPSSRSGRPRRPRDMYIRGIAFVPLEDDQQEALRVEVRFGHSARRVIAAVGAADYKDDLVRRICRLVPPEAADVNNRTLVPFNVPLVRVLAHRDGLLLLLREESTIRGPTSLSRARSIRLPERLPLRAPTWSAPIEWNTVGSVSMNRFIEGGCTIVLPGSGAPVKPIVCFHDAESARRLAREAAPVLPWAALPCGIHVRRGNHCLNWWDGRSNLCVPLPSVFALSVVGDRVVTLAESHYGSVAVWDVVTPDGLRRPERPTVSLDRLNPTCFFSTMDGHRTVGEILIATHDTTGQLCVCFFEAVRDSCSLPLCLA